MYAIEMLNTCTTLHIWVLRSYLCYVKQCNTKLWHFFEHSIPRYYSTYILPFVSWLLKLALSYRLWHVKELKLNDLVDSPS